MSEPFEQQGALPVENQRELLAEELMFWCQKVEKRSRRLYEALAYDEAKNPRSLALEFRNHLRRTAIALNALVEFDERNPPGEHST